MGPEFWKPDKLSKLKECSEKKLTCSESEANTDGCCAVIACKYCVLWEEYGELPVADKTNSGDGMWMATPGGIEFVMWWERASGYTTPDETYTTSFESLAGTEALRLAASGTELNATITTDGNPSIDAWRPRTGSQNLRLFTGATQWAQFDFTVTGTASFSFWYYMPVGTASVDVNGSSSTLTPVSTYTQYTVSGLAAGTHTIRITRTKTTFPTGDALDIDDASITIAGVAGSTDCELVVTFSGEEVYRKTCYEGQSCRDSSDFAEVDLPYLTGTLTWTKDLQRPLPTVTDYETNCIRQLCADCTCTCECLCVSVVNSYDCSTTLGEICDIAYDCDNPLWSGTVGDYAIEVALDDNCGLQATVNGIVYEVAIEPYTSICDSFQATITLADDTVITLRCRECQCEADGNCGVGCCWPKEITELYPCGYLVPVPFEISAPGCDIDGRTGTFTPGGIVDVGSCGACTDSPDASAGTTIGAITVPNPYFCNDTPCSLVVVLRLACEDGAESCCGGFRLWVATSERMVGWDGSAPAGGDPTLYWVKYAPNSCACDPLAMIFEVTFTLDCADTWVGGACDGEPRDCCDPVCGGFTLTI